MRAVLLAGVVLTITNCQTHPSLSGSDLADAMPNDLSAALDDLGPCALGDGGSCTVFPQCGCAPGESCDVATTAGSTGCRPVGSTPNWNACSNASCTVGSTCVVAWGVCAPFCAGDSDCSGHDCVSEFPASRVCSSLCDPVSPQSSAMPYTACGLGVGCQPLFGTNGASYCTSSVDSNGTQGASCASRNCATGFLCVNNQCRKACHAGSKVDCTVGLVCAQLTSPVDGSPVFVGSSALGYCN
jgi:hypothetical protein